ncbi:9874_t:CDS:2 [Racocetra persica]|uniref:9874_t:CDS:1 n=1 Tax=Racocetra persica TaxID=160502 RepID=A0ACA9R7W0_9GLOM|nr:9874_t:CDS:2 [Racocetra persica]
MGHYNYTRTNSRRWHNRFKVYQKSEHIPDKVSSKRVEVQVVIFDDKTCIESVVKKDCEQNFDKFRFTNQNITTQNFGTFGKGYIPISNKPVGFLNYSTSSIFGSKYIGNSLMEKFESSTPHNAEEEVSFGTGAKPLLHEQKKEVTRHTVRTELFRLDREHQWKDMDREHQWKERRVGMFKLNYPKNYEKSPQLSFLKQCLVKDPNAGKTSKVWDLEQILLCVGFE